MMNLRSDRSENISYSFSDFPAYIEKNQLSLYPNYSAVSHWHDDLEFIVVISGQMSYNVNGVLIPLKAGDGIFVNSRQLHCGFSKEHCECVFLCILFHPLLLCTCQFVEQTFLKPVLSDASLPFLVLRQKTDWQNRILQALKQIYEYRSQADGILRIQGLFFQIWAELCAHLSPAAKTATRPNPGLLVLKDMIGFIQRNYKNRLSLGDIASAGKVCKSSCCSIFQNYLNQTPVAYLIDYRLKKSVDLIHNFELSITEISLEVGFSSPGYFTETFHKHFGCSPREYRFRLRQQSLPEIEHTHNDNAVDNTKRQ